MSTEASSLRKMLEYLRLGVWEAFMVEKILYATMSTLKSTVKDETTWHVFIQDFAACLNRAGRLSNKYEQLFREEAYAFMRAKS